MHRLIRILVFAEDADRALAAARKVVEDELVYPNGNMFDSAVDFTYCAADGGGLKAELTIAAALKARGIGAIGGVGPERWGAIPPVLQVSTVRFPCDDTRGMLQAKEALLITKKLFDKNMKCLRYHLANYTDDELFNEVQGKGEIIVDGERIYDNPQSFQCICEDLAGGPSCDEVFLYEFHGAPVTRVQHLQQLITITDTNHEGLDDIPNLPLWIVPFDVHF
jgi:hypothetical protein